jgi:membrane-associated phospholipid phosphatase
MPPRRADVKLDPFTPAAGVAPRSSYSELKYRLRFAWPLKAFGTAALMGVFFAAYFALLRHPAFPVTLMPVTRLDRALPFQAWSMIFYASLWVYVPLASAPLANWNELRRYGFSAVLLSAAGLAIFWAWPTAVPRDPIESGDDAAFAFLRSVDASGNACPSLHAAFAVFSALWLDRALRDLRAEGWVRWMNAAWCAGIVYSTLATKQHVAVDVVAGAALGAIAAWLALERGEPSAR